MGIFNFIKDMLTGDEPLIPKPKGKIGKAIDVATSPEGSLAIKAAIELAAIEYLRLKVDPYAQSAGQKIDDVFSVIDSLVAKIKKAEDMIGNAKKLTEKAGDKLAEWLKKAEDAITGRSEEEIRAIKESEGRAKAKSIGEAEHYISTTSYPDHPTWIPHFNANEPYKLIFSDLTNFLFLGLWGVLLYFNFKTYGRRFFERIRIRRETRKLREKIDRLYGPKIKEITDKLQAIEKSQEVLRLALVNQMKEIETTTTNLSKVLQIGNNLLEKITSGEELTADDRRKLDIINGLIDAYSKGIRKARELAEKAEEEARLGVVTIGESIHGAGLRPLVKEISDIGGSRSGESKEWEF